MALYDSNNELDVHNARERLEWLIKNNKRFEITQKRKTRSMSQNKYLHVVLSYCALEIGETIEDFKQYYFKAEICKVIFEYEHVNKQTGEISTRLRSTTKLSTKEMTDAINMLRNFASMRLGIYIPAPHERHLIDQMEWEVNQKREYLH